METFELWKEKYFWFIYFRHIFISIKQDVIKIVSHK
jgi:hypothetical protein